jgi:hypothetical protein
MAVLFADPGGEYYYSSGISAPGVWSATSGASLINNAAAGALTTYAISLSGSGSVTKYLAANYVTLIVGGRIYWPSSVTATYNLITVTDGATAQAELSQDASGHLTVTRNGTVLGTSTLALVTGSGWHYIEFVITIGPASAGSPNGSAQVYVDNVQWLNLTGVNTKNSSNQYVNRVSWSRVSSGVNTNWKDMVIIETTGGTITTRQGDVQVSAVYPNAAGVNQQFSNTGGATQTASVQDGRSHSGTWPDGDTSYISDSVSGHISDFAHDTLSAGSILAVVHVSYARSDVGTANFEQVALSAGTQHTSASIAVGGTYNYFFDVMEVDPHTSSAWTVSNFNSATFGVAIP